MQEIDFGLNRDKKKKLSNSKKIKKVFEKIGLGTISDYVDGEDPGLNELVEDNNDDNSDYEDSDNDNDDNTDKKAKHRFKKGRK